MTKMKLVTRPNHKKLDAVLGLKAVEAFSILESFSQINVLSELNQKPVTLFGMSALS